jgi:hypothetical protein
MTNITVLAGTDPSACYTIQQITWSFDLTQDDVGSTLSDNNRTSVASLNLSPQVNTNADFQVSVRFNLSPQDMSLGNTGQLTCAYRQDYTSPWTSDSSCTFVPPATCLCNHLTEFTLFQISASGIDTGDDIVDSGSRSLSTGGKVGIAFGVLIFVVLAVIIVLIVVSARRRDRRIYVVTDAEAVESNNTVEMEEQKEDPVSVPEFMHEPEPGPVVSVRVYQVKVKGDPVDELFAQCLDEFSDHVS